MYNLKVAIMLRLTMVAYQMSTLGEPLEMSVFVENGNEYRVFVDSHENRTIYFSKDGISYFSNGLLEPLRAFNGLERVGVSAEADIEMDQFIASYTAQQYYVTPEASAQMAGELWVLVDDEAVIC